MAYDELTILQMQMSQARVNWHSADETKILEWSTPATDQDSNICFKSLKFCNHKLYSPRNQIQYFSGNNIQKWTWEESNM